MISVLISALEMLDFSSFSGRRFPRTGVWKKGKKGNGRKRKSNYLYDSMISIPNYYPIFSFLLSKLKSLKISLPRTNFPFFFFLDNPRIIERSSMRRRGRELPLLAGNRASQLARGGVASADPPLWRRVFSRRCSRRVENVFSSAISSAPSENAFVGGVCAASRPPRELADVKTEVRP